MQQTNPANGTLLGPAYDADGNVISDTDLQNGAQTDYTYNSLNELVQTTGPYPDPSGAAAASSTSTSDDWVDSGLYTVYTGNVIWKWGGADGRGEWVQQTVQVPYTKYDVTTTDQTYTWTFHVTDGEKYELQASWAGESGNTTDATISGGGQSATLDELAQPQADYISTDGTTSTPWQGMLVFTATGTTASFTLTSGEGTTMLPEVQVQEARSVATFTYYPNGALKSETDPLGNKTTFAYDADGNETSETLPDPANGDNTSEDHGAVTSNTYDLAGNLLTTTSPSPTGSGTVTTVTTYDQQNNLLTSEDADGNVTSYTHDQLGETTSLTDTDGNSTYATYDHDGQQTSQSSVAALGYFPDGTVNTQTATSYSFYDGFGNPSTAIDADYRSIGYTFNDVNEETQEQWFDQFGNQTGEVDYTYNAAGLTTEAKNYVGASDSTPVADDHYYYDLAGNVADVSANLEGVSGGSTPVQLGAAYDYNGDMTSLAANIGGTPNYDANYGFTGFSDGVNDFVNDYAYDQFGDLTSIVQTLRAPGGDAERTTWSRRRRSRSPTTRTSR